MSNTKCFHCGKSFALDMDLVAAWLEEHKEEHPKHYSAQCHFCRRGQYHLCTEISFQYRRGQGALTPYFIAPQKWVHRLPPGISYAEGALLEPLSVAVHAAKKSRPELSESSAIWSMPVRF